MDLIGKLDRDLKDLSGDFTLEALAEGVQPAIDAALKEHQKDRQRKSPLSPRLTTWLVLALCLQRAMGYLDVLSWVLSGLRHRWPELDRRPVTDGAITKARRRLGVDVLRDVFRFTTRTAAEVVADFHGLLSVIIDGSILTAPDTPANTVCWGRPTASARRGIAGFPQVRLVALLVGTCHVVLDAVFGPSRGKGTGEVTVARELVLRNARRGLLFLLDRGFFAIAFLNEILRRGGEFLVRVPKGPKLRPIRGHDARQEARRPRDRRSPQDPRRSLSDPWLPCRSTRDLAARQGHHCPGARAPLPLSLGSGTGLFVHEGPAVLQAHRSVPNPAPFEGAGARGAGGLRAAGHLQSRTPADPEGRSNPRVRSARHQLHRCTCSPSRSRRPDARCEGDVAAGALRETSPRHRLVRDAAAQTSSRLPTGRQDAKISVPSQALEST